MTRKPVTSGSPTRPVRWEKSAPIVRDDLGDIRPATHDHRLGATGA